MLRPRLATQSFVRTASLLCRVSAALLCIAASVSAQRPDSAALPRVVVTATRIATTLGVAIPSVTVLDARALERQGVRDVSEALRLTPGVAVARSGGAGAQTSFFVRGGESDYVRVLVDGAPVNDAGGAIDLSALTLDQVDRIEVVRGPNSVLHGTDAVTGVVQIFTRRAWSGVQGEAMVRGGSHGTRVGTLALGGGGDRLAASLGGAVRRTDGIHPFNNQNANRTASGTADYRQGASRVSVTGRRLHDTYHVPTDGAGRLVDRNAFRVTSRTTLAIDAERQVLGRVSLGATLSAVNGRDRTDDARDDAADSAGLHTYRALSTTRRRVADVRAALTVAPEMLLTFGFERAEESLRSRDSSNFSSAPNVFSATRRNTAGFAQLLADRGRLQVMAGARYDANQTFGAFRTARVGAAMRLWRGAVARASVGNAFKAPAFLEQFNTAFTVGNRDLRPERSRSWEVGLSRQAPNEGVGVSVTWFDQTFRDLVQYTYLDARSANYFNVAAATARGAEIEVQYDLARRVRVDANVTLLRSRVTDAGFDREAGAGAVFVDGQRLLRRPPRSGSLRVSVTPRASWVATGAVVGVSARDDRDFSSFPASAVVLPAYARVDVSLERRFATGVSGREAAATLRIDNVFGHRYGEIAGFSAPGRVWLAGLRIRGER